MDSRLPTGGWEGMQEQAMEQETHTPQPIHGTERMMGESLDIDRICSANKIDEFVTVVLWLSRRSEWEDSEGARRGSSGGSGLWDSRVFQGGGACPDTQLPAPGPGTHLSSPPVMKLDLAEP